MKYLSLLFIIFSFGCFAQNNAPVVLISIDGFAQHYMATHNPEFLQQLASKGLYAKEGMQPVYPSKTFPNHLSMVTGKYPAEHGIVHNNFYRKDKKAVYNLGAGRSDSSWLKAEPIWTTLEKANIKTANFFWPESEARLDNILPSYFFRYKHSVPNKKRLAQVLKWLQSPEDKRPQFITTYFSTVDSAGHDFGIAAAETIAAVNEIDALLAWFYSELEQNNIEANVVIVSDHGMIDIAEKKMLLADLNLPADIDKAVNGQTQVYIYEDDEHTLKKTYEKLTKEANKHYKVYLKEQYPSHWHMSKEAPYMPDMIINTEVPYTFSVGKYDGKATHGFDPKESTQLNAIFIATGPNIKAGQLPEFSNIYVYDFIAQILNLPNYQQRIVMFEPYIQTTNR